MTIYINLKDFHWQVKQFLEAKHKPNRKTSHFKWVLWIMNNAYIKLSKNQCFVTVVNEYIVPSIYTCQKF